jgi:hypothetical protein
MPTFEGYGGYDLQAVRPGVSVHAPSPVSPVVSDLDAHALAFAGQKADSERAARQAACRMQTGICG